MSTVKLEQIKNYFERRLEKIQSAPFEGQNAEKMMLEVLRLAARMVPEAVPGSHFEFSIWTDPKEPKVIAYFDSACNVRPRSDAERKTNPNFYREKNYEVISLLDRPSPEIIWKDRPSAANYNYSSPAQGEKIKSTMLYCFDINRPAVLVVTSNIPGALSRESFPDELLRTLSLAIRADLELFDKSVTLAPPQSGAPPEPFIFSWLHLSDIHFGAGSMSHRFNQNKVCEAILRDTRDAPCSVNSVFITGDIAFQAAKEEYLAAGDWIQKLANALNISKDRFFLVPGNHDVNRQTAARADLGAYHRDSRLHATKLDELLALPDARKALLAKLTDYEDFVKTTFPSHPRSADDWSGDWEHDDVFDVSANQVVKIKVIGLSTVWLSDSGDGRSLDGKSFAPNMVIADRQLTAMQNVADSADLLLLLSHHPVEWLTPRSKKELSSNLSRVPHVHLCGHVHQKKAGLSRHFGAGRQEICFVAGALHNEELQPHESSEYHGEHGYSWGAIRRKGGVLQVGWSPRVYVPELDCMRADRTRYDLDQLGFAWEDLP